MNSDGLGADGEGFGLESQNERERYFVDIDWYERNGLSFQDAVEGRMCTQCQGRLDEELEEKYPTIDPKTKRPVYELRRYRRGERPIPVIRDCCSRKGGFITPDMAVLEVVFRVLLANGNQPMPLEDVREQLREWCPTGRCQWLLVPPETLERVVEHDDFYGLQRYQVPAPI